MLELLIWDVDGTLAETERDGHLPAFNAAFEAEGLPWRWSAARYGELLAVTGGRERLLYDMASRSTAPADMAVREVLARRLHERKNTIYAQTVAAGRIPLREGVRELMDDCTAAGLPMAIATTTSRSNVEALLGAHFGAHWQRRFAAVLCGEDVERKKPDPQVYCQVLEQLGVAPHAALAIEDSPPGVSASVQAGVPVIVTRSAFFADGEVSGALAVGPGLHTTAGWLAAVSASPSASSAAHGRIDLGCLRAWYRA